MKKHKEILVLAKSKLNSIESLVSEALIDMEISYYDFKWERKKWRNERNEEMKKWKKTLER